MEIESKHIWIGGGVLVGLFLLTRGGGSGDTTSQQIAASSNLGALNIQATTEREKSRNEASTIQNAQVLDFNKTALGIFSEVYQGQLQYDAATRQMKNDVLVNLKRADNEANAFRYQYNERLANGAAYYKALARSEQLGFDRDVQLATIQGNTARAINRSNNSANTTNSIIDAAGNVVSGVLSIF